MKAAKTVAALHDLSGVGRCALTVAIPVISAMGAQVIPAPTAVLSAHTAFPKFVSLDLTDYLESCLNQWCDMGMRFDSIYTGYMASTRQTALAERFMERQPGALKIVDPVLGDDGRMYRALPKEMPDAMRRLCRCADVITPNLTEAALLTGLSSPVFHGDGPLGTNSAGQTYTLPQLESLLTALMELGSKTALITGVPLEDTHVNAWMAQDGKAHTYAYVPLPASFPGTGDLFASVLAGALVNEMTFENAVALATDYVRDAMLYTMECGVEPIYGVQLERTLDQLHARQTSI